jgi:hypothetical protein
MQRTWWIVLIALCLVCAGCLSETDEDRMRAGAESVPFHLDSEQVTLTLPQVDCGASKDLWEEPVLGAGRSIARLKQPGRDIGFTDDVSVDDRGFILPYTQVRGDFMLGFESLVAEKDGPERGTKTAQAKIRVKVNNDCFAGGLPIMGIIRGQFKQEAPATAVFLMDGEDSWHLDRIVH